MIGFVFRPSSYWATIVLPVLLPQHSPPRLLPRNFHHLPTSRQPRPNRLISPLLAAVSPRHLLITQLRHLQSLENFSVFLLDLFSCNNTLVVIWKQKLCKIWFFCGKYILIHFLIIVKFFHECGNRKILCAEIISFPKSSNCSFQKASFTQPHTAPKTVNSECVPRN